MILSVYFCWQSSVDVADGPTLALNVLKTLPVMGGNVMVTAFWTFHKRAVLLCRMESLYLLVPHAFGILQQVLDHE